MNEITAEQVLAALRQVAIRNGITMSSALA